jgi:lipoprotein NlpD
VVCLVACGGSGYRAPVENRQVKHRPSTVPSAHYVKRGETLYSIAWRYGLDYRLLARANSISSPYTIFPGQKITLKISTNTTGKASPSANPAPKPKTPVATVRVPSSVTQAKKPKKADLRVSKWRWPTSGKVTRHYSVALHKGIDIDGKLGDPIFAVAAGTVVYAGTGIVGFGELLIVKHNDIYLSAYGHNNRLLVAEGQQVKTGQRIAEKGSSGTDTVKLHFEIRKEGKPVDPQKLLPAR